MMIMFVVSTCTVKYGYIFGTVGIFRVHQVHFRYCRYIKGIPGTL